MPRTIQLTELGFNKITLHLDSQSMFVPYKVADASGEFTRHGTAIFYRNPPTNPDGTARELKADEFLLSAQEVQALGTLINRVGNRIEAVQLVDPTVP